MALPTTKHHRLGKQISVISLSKMRMAWDIPRGGTNGKFTTSQSLMNSSLVTAPACYLFACGDHPLEATDCMTLLYERQEDLGSLS